MLPAFDSPRLLADIGGTYARFTLEAAPGVFEHAATLRCADHADFHAAVSAYLGAMPAGQVQHAAVAIANPVEGDEVRMTNYHWQFSIEQMRQRLGLATLVVVNDFTALAMALPRLAPDGKRQIGGGAARERSVVGLLGAGTGLGVSGLIPADDGFIALGTEGGHASFSPRDEREIAILRHALGEFDHVSFERLLSGPGLELIHDWLCERAGLRRARRTAAQISEVGLRTWRAGEAAHAQQASALCLQSLQRFCALLGGFAADVALTLDARGGLYIGGGIVPRLGDFVEQSLLRERFEDKGRFSSLLAGVPIYVIHSRHPALLGAAAALQQHMERVHHA